MRCLCFALACAWVTASLWGQDPPAEEAPAGPPVKLVAIRATPASISSGSPAWNKILIDFEVDQPWIDGLQFSVSALVGDGTKDRPFAVLAGLLRHLNVPQGKSTTALYVSPNTTTRYGGLAAVHVDIYVNDRVISSLDWQGKGGKAPANWMNIYDRKEGALLPITATPWLTVEYDKYPDILLGR